MEPLFLIIQQPLANRHSRVLVSGIQGLSQWILAFALLPPLFVIVVACFTLNRA